MGRVLFLAAAAIASLAAIAIAQDLGTERQLAEGKDLYDTYCAQCHGIDGAGKGVAAPYVKPRPRDFTAGKYKLRTTPSGAVPTKEDIKRSIRNGLPYTSMPGWPQFSESELDSLTYYLKGFSPAFANAGELEVLEIPSPPAITEESVQRGREVYENMGCAKCHGDQGRGDGQSAPTLGDDWGYHLPSADFTQPWTFIGGATREDIYRTYMTGLSGTGMPSYADEEALAKEDRWPLVDYVYTRADSRQPNFATLVVSKPVDEVDIDQGAALFEGSVRARFPMVGQIIEPGRNFYPAMNSIEVRSVYSRDDIAFLVQWNDMRAETEGTNDPSLPVPPFDPVAEDEAEQVGAGEGTGGQDPFGDIFATPSPAPEAEEGNEDATIAGRTEFNDAVAIQVPTTLPLGFRKPYFIFGDPQNSVDIWFVDLGNGIPRPFRGKGSQLLTPDEGEGFEVSHSYEHGLWSVIFKRKLESSRSVSFLEEQFVPISFSVWDGFNRERGNKRSLSGWYHVYLEPADKPSPIGPVTRSSLAVFIGLVVIVILVRRSYTESTAQKEVRS